MSEKETRGPGEPCARAVLVAAGASTRMGTTGGARKPWIELLGAPLLAHTVSAFARTATVGSIVLVVHADDLGAARELRAGSPDFARVVGVVAGGSERGDSVRIGCNAAADREEPGFEVLCVHDAARPLVAPAAIDDVVRAAVRTGAGLLAIPVRDTLKHSDDGERATRTVDRSPLWCAQTPQCFERARFLDCLERAGAEGYSPTDDASLWERYVGPVTLVRGDATNRKITGPEDLETARALLAWRASTRREA